MKTNWNRTETEKFGKNLTKKWNGNVVRNWNEIETETFGKNLTETETQ